MAVTISEAVWPPYFGRCQWLAERDRLSKAGCYISVWPRLHSVSSEMQVAPLRVV